MTLLQSWQSNSGLRNNSAFFHVLEKHQSFTRFHTPELRSQIIPQTEEADQDPVAGCTSSSWSQVQQDDQAVF